jgi:hypothetical protein
MPDLVTLTIRPSTQDDAAACRACVVELQDAERALDSRLRTGDEMADDYLRQMHERCRDYGGSILVAEHAGAVVGLTMVLTRVFDKLRAVRQSQVVQLGNEIRAFPEVSVTRRCEFRGIQ